MSKRFVKCVWIDKWKRESEKCGWKNRKEKVKSVDRKIEKRK